jgi:hypothetical protein
MGLAMMSPTHPRMLLWGQRRCCKAHWMWHQRLHKFIKFGCGAMEGRFATSATLSFYVIVVSILLWDCTRWGAIRFSLVIAKNC